METCKKVVVSAINPGGEPDFFFVKVVCSEEQYNNGDHIDAAKDAAEKEGYEAYLAYDEGDPTGRALMGLFNWESANTVSIPTGRELAVITLHSADGRIVIINYAEWKGKLTTCRFVPEGEPLLQTISAVFMLDEKPILKVSGDIWRHIEATGLDEKLVKLLLRGATAETLKAAVEKELALT